MNRTVTIGGAAGMWGDSYLATPQLLADGRCDYLIYESLAEVTMAVLTKGWLKDPTQGYARDVITIIGEHLAEFRERNIRIVTNAGGINPEGAAAAIRTIAEKAGVRMQVAAVTGDDMIPLADTLRNVGVTETTHGTPIPKSPVSFSAYLGARPIASALAAGADIVITGRCADSALVLGPLIHELGWKPTDFDRLSSGSLAGHLLECGPQSTGGLLTDWRDTASWANPGFPIAEVREDGSFIVTVAEGTDAIVDRRTVGEQMVYEIGDPAAYLLPDVTCDWTQVELSEPSHNRVEVRGARGFAPTPTLKACAQVFDGFRTQIMFWLGGRDAPAKGRRSARDLVERARSLFAAKGFADFRRVHIEIIGTEEDSFGANARAVDTREVCVRIALHHDDSAALTAFVREFPSIGLAGPMGVGGFAGGLPKPMALLRLESFLVPREFVQPRIDLDGAAVPNVDVPVDVCRPLSGERGTDAPIPIDEQVPTVDLPLVAIAYGRSGDKGDNTNIGIIARDRQFEPIIAAQVTAERVAEFLAHFGASRVERFALPGIGAVNFLLHEALGGGGVASLRIDPQGKAAAQQLLELPVAVPCDLLSHPGLADEPEVRRARSESESIQEN